MPKDVPRPASKSRSIIHQATSSSVVTPGMMTSLERARSAISRDRAPASAKAASSLATRRERKSETKEEKPNYIRVERSYGRFYRSFTLPKAVDEKNIAAKYENGVLTIRVPKAEGSKARRIEIS